MDNDNEKRAERDKNLVVRICGTVQNVREALYEWIEQELKAQRYKVQMRQALYTGSIQERAIEYEMMINELELDRIPEAVERQKTRVKEVVDALGAGSDPFDEILYLEESTYRLERLARMVMQNRFHLDELSSLDSADAEFDSEDEEDDTEGL